MPDINGLPYPNASAIPDGPGAFLALNLALTSLPTGLVTPGANISVFSQSLQVDKLKVVTLICRLTRPSGTIAGGDVMGTLPIGFRPIITGFINCVYYAGSWVTGSVIINDNGSIVPLELPASSTEFAIMATFRAA